MQGERTSQPVRHDRIREYEAFCERHSDWAITMVEALVRRESPTTDKVAVDRCGVALAEYLNDIGAHVTVLPQDSAGDHLFAELGDGPTQVLLLGHFDTVWPMGQLEHMPLQRKGHRLFGPGTFDMKGGIAIGVLAARAVLEVGMTQAARVAMLWTSDEETGSATSQQVILQQGERSKAVLVLEPSGPSGAVKTSRKGCGQFELTVTGVSAHAGIEPDRGASAVHELARQIVSLESLQDVESGVTINVGRVYGGTRPNVVADKAQAMVDVRVRTVADADRIERAFAGLTTDDPRTQLQVNGEFRPPLERNAAVRRLYEVAKQVASDLGRDLTEFSTGGGSDGNLTSARGIPTLDGLGAVGEGAHALHEQIDISALPWRAAMLAGLIARVVEE